MKTIIVLAIFAALMFLYIIYMSGEFSKSSKKLEAFEEASNARKEQTSTTSASTPSASTTSTTSAPSSTSTTSTTPATSTTSAPSSTSTTPATSTTGAPSFTSTTSTPQKSKPVKDLEKTLFIVNAYEQIFGTKIGPEELEELNQMFENVNDREVIIYKLKELRSDSTEIDTIFELVDISNKLGSIVNRLKARGGVRAEVQGIPKPPNSMLTTPSTTATTTTPTTATPTSTPNDNVEGYRALPKYLSF
jgi:hypothetical protein